jgi:hypothetical protein
MGGRGAAQHWWDYVEENIRLGKKEEEALRCEGDGDNNNGCRGRGGRGGEGEVDMEGRSLRGLLSGPRHCN